MANGTKYLLFLNARVFLKADEYGRFYKCAVVPFVAKFWYSTAGNDFGTKLFGEVIITFNLISMFMAYEGAHLSVCIFWAA